jgi:hypothetical protein
MKRDNELAGEQRREVIDALTCELRLQGRADFAAPPTLEGLRCKTEIANAKQRLIFRRAVAERLTEQLDGEPMETMIRIALTMPPADFREAFLFAFGEALNDKSSEFATDAVDAPVIE